MDNPEKQATFIKVAIKNGQSRETECIGHKMQNEDKQNTKQENKKMSTERDEHRCSRVFP